MMKENVAERGQWRQIIKSVSTEIGWRMRMLASQGNRRRVEQRTNRSWARKGHEFHLERTTEDHSLALGGTLTPCFLALLPCFLLVLP
jgi:hypothetical protein